MTKFQSKLENIERFTLTALNDRENGSLENCLNNLRIAGEAICKGLILSRKGETIGEKIIFGEIDDITFSPKKRVKKPDFYNLIDICMRNHFFINYSTSLPMDTDKKINQKRYHHLDDIRSGGNKGSHDPDGIKEEVIQDDIDYCIPIFKEIIKWYWTEHVNRQIPDTITNAFNGEIDTSLISKFENEDWDNLYQSCDAFATNQAFILISPPQFNNISLNQLSILDRIQWKFIFDFNPKTKDEGLYHTINNSSLSLNNLSIDDRNASVISSFNYLFANGLKSIPSTITQNERMWRRKKYPDFCKKLIVNFLRLKNQRVTIISLFDDEKYIKDIIDSFDSNITNTDLLRILIISENEDRLSRLKDVFDGYDNIEFICLSVSSFIEGIRQSISPSLININTKTIQIPAKNSEGESCFVDISDTYQFFMKHSIEVLYQGVEQEKSVNNDEIGFYQGNLITWKDISIDNFVRRDKQSRLNENVLDNLRKSKFAYSIELFHKPGGGGTTLARVIAYSLKDEFPTIIISKYDRRKTSEALFQLAEITQKPILAIVEAYQVSQNDFNKLIRKTNDDKKHIVFLYVKRVFKESKDNSNSIFVQEKMLSINERSRFVKKFKDVAIVENKSKIKDLKDIDLSNCDIIDFALTAFEKSYSSETLQVYLESYINELPQSQTDFVLYISLIYYYTQNKVSELWFKNIFPHDEDFSFYIDLQPSKKRFITKLIVQEKIKNPSAGNEDIFTGHWQPKYYRFSKEIIKIILGGVNIANSEDWKDYLDNWSIKLIQAIKESNEYLTDDVKKVLNALFLERDNEDHLGLNEDYRTINDNTKFARLIADIGRKEKQERVLKKLVEAYPNEGHYRGHYARFLFEKANSPEEYDLAEEETNIALGINDRDTTLWNVKGMCSKRRIEFLLRSNIDEYNEQEIDDLELIIKDLTKEAIHSFEQSRLYNSFNFHSHTAQIRTQTMVIQFGIKISNITIENFLLETTDNTFWYKEQFDSALTLLEEAKYSIELSKDLDNSKDINKSKQMISSCEGSVFELLGNFSKAIDRFKNLSNSSNRTMRPYFRKMYIYATLSQKVGNNPKRFYQAWEKLSDYEYQSLKETLEYNIQEQPGNPQNIRLWFQAVRNANHYMSIEDCTSNVRFWLDNTSEDSVFNLEANYYLYVLYSSKAISEKESFLEENVKKATQYLNICIEKAKNDRYSFEWYGSGQGIKKLVNHSRLGGMRSSDKFFKEDKLELLERVKGTIVSIESRQKGTIKLRCGLESFFVPAHGEFQKGVDETKEVSFYIGFRQKGLAAWKVERIEEYIFLKVEESQPLEDFEIEGVDDSEFNIEIDNNIEDTQSEDNTKDTLPDKDFFSNKSKLKGLMIRGKIDLEKFKRKK
jgi:hypothetical protein